MAVCAAHSLSLRKLLREGETANMHITYSLGITGYELWSDPDIPDHLMVLYVGTQREQTAKSYKVRQTRNGRQFVQPYGRRIYLDQCLPVRMKI